jgi:aryl-alcohol dehydrogenase-like predicted oxidoreductase
MNNYSGKVNKRMKYRTLGKTGLKVSAVSLGMWAIGGDAWGPVEDKESLAALRRAWELGVNFYDTADVYGRGHSEKILAQLIAQVPREQIYVATKVGLWRAVGERPNPYTDPQMILEDCDASLMRLGIETIDVYQCHLWFDENVEAFTEAFLKLKEQGKIRFAGVSTNEFPHLEHFDAAMDGVDVLQIDYSLFNRQPEEEILPYCQQNNIGVIVRGPLAMGKLTGKFTAETTFPEGDIRRNWVQGENRQRFLRDLERVEALRFLGKDRTMAQAALAYVLHHPAVSTVIPGAKNSGQVEDNVGAADLPPSTDDLERVRAILSE